MHKKILFFKILNLKLGRAADVNQTIDCSLIKKELKSPGVIKKISRIFQDQDGLGFHISTLNFFSNRTLQNFQNFDMISIYMGKVTNLQIAGVFSTE